MANAGLNAVSREPNDLYIYIVSAACGGCSLQCLRCTHFRMHSFTDVAGALLATKKGYLVPAPLHIQLLQVGFFDQ